MVMIWYFDNKSPLSINIFCHISQMDNHQAWMMFVFVFLQLDVFELLSNFLQNHLIVIFFPLLEFLVATA